MEPCREGFEDAHGRGVILTPDMEIDLKDRDAKKHVLAHYWDGSQLRENMFGCDQIISIDQLTEFYRDWPGHVPV